ncbi:MAG: 3-oxoacyl-ACP synthase III family protein [Polyangia bacterium]
MNKKVGIIAVGVYLPDEIRTNDFWPASISATWLQKWQERLPAMSNWYSENERAESNGIAQVLAALMEMKNDPFQGSVERRVAPEDMPSSEMEIRAAREALERAQIPASEVDMLIAYSSVPDYLTTPNACAVHAGLGLPEKCFTFSMEAACNSFLMQLSLAEKMIHCGQARYALLVQSSNFTRLIPREHSPSPMFGDGATAVLVGPVGDGAGILGQSHHTDGRLHCALATGVPGKHWYEEGRNVFYANNLDLARQQIVVVADHSRQVVHEALGSAGLGVNDVDFYAPHQGTAWLRRVTQDFIGLERARYTDTFPFAASLSAANIPLVLATAQRDNNLRKGDVVAMFGGGAGETWSSVIMRWGTD